MDRNQTGNILIGAGVLAGLGTLAYWLMSGGSLESGAPSAVADECLTPAGRFSSKCLPTFTAPVTRPTAPYRPMISV